MKFEQIDTSTDEGKLEVMRKVIAEGRKRAYADRPRPSHYAEVTAGLMYWNWVDFDYQIIAEAVGPDEVWLPVAEDGAVCGAVYRHETHANNHSPNAIAVRYVRADQ